MRLILEEQQKYLQSFIHNATYHPMNPNAHVTYQTVNLFSSDKCFICFISDYPYYIWWNIITIPKYERIAPHVLSTSTKLYRQCCDVLGTLVKIDVLIHVEQRYVCTLESHFCYFLRSSLMFSLSLSKIGWILFSNAKETLQKMLVRKCSYQYQTYEGLKISANY